MNRTAEYDFTIVIPAYNEEESLPALEKSLLEYLPNCLYKACVLLVDDGSKDRTKELMKDMCERNKDFFYISFNRNRGKSTAMQAGFDNTFSKYVGYIDADLQTVPEDFNLLLAEIPNYSMVTGIRAKRKDTGFYKLQSKIGNGWRKMFTHDGAIDTGCPLKVFKTENAKKIPFFEGMHRFIPAMILLQDGGCYKQLPVRHFPRAAGKSKYNIWNRMFCSFADCFAFLWMKSRYYCYTIDSEKVD